MLQLDSNTLQQLNILSRKRNRQYFAENKRVNKRVNSQSPVFRSVLHF